MISFDSIHCQHSIRQAVLTSGLRSSNALVGQGGSGDEFRASLRPDVASPREMPRVQSTYEAKMV